MTLKYFTLYFLIFLFGVANASTEFISEISSEFEPEVNKYVYVNTAWDSSVKKRDILVVDQVFDKFIRTTRLNDNKKFDVDKLKYCFLSPMDDKCLFPSAEEIKTNTGCSKLTDENIRCIIEDIPQTVFNTNFDQLIRTDKFQEQLQKGFERVSKDCSSLSAFTADGVLVSGRVGKKSKMNGVYYKRAELHQGKFLYQQLDSDCWHIRWYPKSNYWFITDNRESDELKKVAAYVNQDVSTVDLVTENWKVPADKYQPDTNLKVSRFSKPDGLFEDMEKMNEKFSHDLFTDVENVNGLANMFEGNEFSENTTSKKKKNRKKKKNINDEEKETEEKIDDETKIDTLKRELAECKNTLKETELFYQQKLQSEDDKHLKSLQESELFYQQKVQVLNLEWKEYKIMKEEEIMQLKTIPQFNHKTLQSLSLADLKVRRKETAAYSKNIDTEIEDKEKMKEDEKLCRICLDKKIDHSANCGHCFCGPCINELINEPCPICRETITSFIRVYLYD